MQRWRGGVREFNYKGECEDFEIPRGRYLFEVWGAQGGLCGLSDEHARGGYTFGIIKLNNYTKLKVCVGGQGKFTNVTKNQSPPPPLGGFNGGGNGSNGKREASCSGGGGGATDIRLSDNVTRLIVSGGGGGCAVYANNNIYGGFGGGLIGGDGNQIENSKGQNKGRGGQQEFTENGGDYTGETGTEASPGAFGLGGNASSISQASSGGGGGGYFGGGGGADTGSGGGGSGFLPSYMIGKIYRGDETFKSPSGENERGLPGDGFAKITPLNPDSCKILQPIHFQQYTYIFILTAFK